MCDSVNPPSRALSLRRRVKSALKVPYFTSPTIRLATAGLVLRKRRESVNAFRCFFAEGEIGGLHACGATFTYILPLLFLFAKPFIFKIAIEKEGLPRDSPAGLGAGGPRFESGRPDHLRRVRPLHATWMTNLRLNPRLRFC